MTAATDSTMSSQDNQDSPVEGDYLGLTRSHAKIVALLAEHGATFGDLFRDPDDDDDHEELCDKIQRLYGYGPLCYKHAGLKDDKIDMLKVWDFDLGEEPDTLNVTPLHVSALFGWTDILLNYDCDEGEGYKSTVNETDSSGMTAYHYLALSEDFSPEFAEKYAKCLEDEDEVPSIFIKDRRGMNPFHLAAAMNHGEFIKYVYINDPEPAEGMAAAKDVHGNTPLDVAKVMKHESIISLFEDFEDANDKRPREDDDGTAGTNKRPRDDDGDHE